MSFNESNTGSLKAGATFEVGVLVKIVSGALHPATLTEEYVGVALRKASAIGDIIPFRYKNAGGSVELLTEASVSAANLPLYGRGAGKVSTVSTSSALRVGVSLRPAGANELVEALLDR